MRRMLCRLAATAAALALTGTVAAAAPDVSPVPRSNPHYGAGAPAPDVARIHPRANPWRMAAASVPADALGKIRPMPNPRMTSRVATSGLGPLSPVILTARLKPRPRPEALSAPAEVAPGSVGVAALRPRPDAGPAGEVVLASSGSMRLPPLALSAPPGRPGNLGEVTLAAAVFTDPLPKLTLGKKGAVCGDPSIRGRTIPPIAAKMKGCGLKDGVEVTSVAGVGLSTPAVVDCATAKALKRWVEDGVIPAVGRSGGGVARLEVAASYACRPRNNQKGARVSEHGKGKAIDISAITLANGSTISVLDHWGEGKAGRALASMRAAACGPFNTVLGPGSDRHHRNHFHLDTASYRSGAYCR